MSTFCRTSLNYIAAEAATKPVEVVPKAVEVDIRDGRTAGLPGWAECGFELIGHRAAVTDWSDDDQIVAVHYPEMEELARKMTGADVALVSGHIKRSPDDARRHEQLSPITFVHSDFAAGHIDYIRSMFEGSNDAPAAALARNGVTAADVTGARRIVILQFWRNLGPARMDFPLAFCDARTVSPAEGRAIHVTNYAGTGSNFDALAIVEPADPSAHAWYVFPELTDTEAVAFRTYDTDRVRDRETWFTPHSAFHDPQVPVGNPARISIELRATCLF